MGFPLIFALGAVSQGAAEPFYRGDDEARAFEAASVVTPDVQPPIGDQVLTDFGSTPEPPPAEEADEIDPWAEAFAEGSRLPLVRFAPAAPEYPVVVNEQVQYFVDLFTGKRRELVTLWVNRSSKYLAMIRDVLRSRGLPEELAYTAMIESGFKPDAVSRVGAKGMWQFMAPTARRYGLRVDTWVDERYDPEKSTIAAAGYLKDLYAQFGSWALAQAAYNAGEVKILRAMKKTGSSDFWALADSKYLKRETKDFVPQIHAATVIGRDPDRYGFEFDDVEPAAFETVRVPGRTDLRRLAATSGIPFQTLRALNRVLVRGITPPGRAWDLRVPTGSADAVRTALAPRHRTPIRVAGSPKVTRAASRVDVHVVRPKDTVSSIAKQYGVSVSEVLKMNSLESQARIRPGDRLRVATRPSVERDGEGGFR